MKKVLYAFLLFFAFCTSLCFAKTGTSLNYMELDGEWELFLDHTPEEIFRSNKNGIKADCIAQVPGFWRPYVKEYKNSDVQERYGCYRKVVGGLLAGQKYSIWMKDSPLTSCAVYVNGKLVAKNGEPELFDFHMNQEEKCRKSHSSIRPIQGDFYPDAEGNAEVIFFISNYYYRKSGLGDIPYIGPSTSITRLETILVTTNTVIIGILLFIALMNLIQFFINMKRKEHLFLAITSFIFALRVSTAAFCLLSIVFPSLSAEWKQKLEYMVNWLCPACILAQIYILYPQRYEYIIFRWLKEKFLRIACLGFAIGAGIITLVAPGRIANRMVPVLQVVFGVISVYVLVKCFVEAKHKSPRIGFYFASCSVLILGGIIDIVYTKFKGLLPMSLFPFFLLIFILIQIILLAANQNAYYKQTVKISSDLKELNEEYLKFVPRQFLGILGKENLVNVALGDNSRIEMSIIFSKVKIFSSEEALQEKEQFILFKEYLRQVNPVIENHNGFVCKFISGGFMTLFPKSADDSILAALEILEVSKKITERYKSQGYVLKSGLGLHYGKMIIGTIGEENRMDDTVISDTVNTASRIELVTENLDRRVILSESLFEQLNPNLKHKLNFIPLEAMHVKGKEKPLNLFECTLMEGGAE